MVGFDKNNLSGHFSAGCRGVFGIRHGEVLWQSIKSFENKTMNCFAALAMTNSGACSEFPWRVLGVMVRCSVPIVHRDTPDLGSQGDHDTADTLWP